MASNRASWLSTLLAVSLHAAAEAARGSCTLTPVDAMHKVMPGAQPTALAQPVAAAGGELIHLQVAVSGGLVSPGAKVVASVEGLGAATVRAVVYVNLTLPLPAGNNIGPASKPGVFPDPLVPLGGDAADLVEGRHLGDRGAPQVFWVTIAVPRAASPGAHKGTFTAAGCGGPASFAVMVSGWSLPAVPSQLTGSQFQAHNIEPFTSPACAAALHGQPKSTIINSCCARAMATHRLIPP